MFFLCDLAIISIITHESLRMVCSKIGKKRKDWDNSFPLIKDKPFGGQGGQFCWDGQFAFLVREDVSAYRVLSVGPLSV